LIKYPKIVLGLSLTTIPFLVGCIPVGPSIYNIKNPGCHLWSAVSLPSSTLSAKKVKQIPVSVGIYYKLKFREKIDGGHYPICTNYQVGSSSEEVFDIVLKNFFQEVVQVDGLPPYKGSNPKIGGVIEPLLEFPGPPWNGFKFGTLGESSESPGETINLVTIHYKFNFYSSKGKLISNFIVKGEGKNTDRGLAVLKAIENAGENFLPTFLKQMEVQRWLYQLQTKWETSYDLVIQEFERR
jgi:hypothetical protein